MSLYASRASKAPGFSLWSTCCKRIRIRIQFFNLEAYSQAFHFFRNDADPDLQQNLRKFLCDHRNEMQIPQRLFFFIIMVYWFLKLWCHSELEKSEWNEFARECPFHDIVFFFRLRVHHIPQWNRSYYHRTAWHGILHNLRLCQGSFNLFHLVLRIRIRIQWGPWIRIRMVWNLLPV